jgi:hypothetical protein
MVLYGNIIMSETFGQSAEVSFLGFDGGKKKKKD